jgi:hypothetical protein
MPSSRTLISSQTLASSAASVTFSSISATYTDLVLRISARADAATPTVYLNFNGDTSASGTLYSHTYIRGNGSTATSSRASSNTTVEIFGGNNQSTYTANTFSNMEIYIPSYTTTTSKPMGIATVAEDNNTTANFVNATAGLYRNSTALSSILIASASGNFVSGSSFYLYGIKNS